MTRRRSLSKPPLDQHCPNLCPRTPLMTIKVGDVATTLSRYPVKSMRGARLLETVSDL